jgi:hypothetical protein
MVKRFDVEVSEVFAFLVSRYQGAVFRAGAARTTNLLGAP